MGGVVGGSVEGLGGWWVECWAGLVGRLRVVGELVGGWGGWRVSWWVDWLLGWLLGWLVGWGGWWVGVVGGLGWLVGSTLEIDKKKEILIKFVKS